MAIVTPQIVIDNGSGEIKAGFDKDARPSCVLSTVGGRSLTGSGFCLGSNAHEGVNVDMERQPIERGIIKDWELMEEMWKQCFKELKADSSENRILITESAQNKANREQITQVMFEKFHVPAIHVKDPGSLVVYSQEELSGLVLDVGETMTTCTPFFEGFKISEGVKRLEMGGRDITELLKKILTNRYPEETVLRRTANDIKEKECFVAWDYDQEKTLLSTRPEEFSSSYTIPNGRTLQINDERIQCTEYLFKPSIFQRSTLLGIHKLIYESLMKCEIDTRRSLYGNILVAGGTTLLPGFIERLNKELCALAPATVSINLIVPPDRKHSAWLGGTKFVSLISTFENQWITKQEYEDSGPSVVHKKCSH